MLLDTAIVCNRLNHNFVQLFRPPFQGEIESFCYNEILGWPMVCAGLSDESLKRAWVATKYGRIVGLGKSH